MKLHFEWAGREDGPIVILSHSLGANLGMWRPQIEALREHFRLLLYDHPGHGNSPPSDWVRPISEFGRDVVTLMNDLEIEKAHFCGLSLGGMVGLWLGAHTPNRVDRLILCNTAAQIESKSLLQARIAQIEATKNLEDIVDNVLGAWFTESFRLGAPEDVKTIRDMVLSTDPVAYASTAQTVCELDLRDAIPKVEAPTFVIYGNHDPATPPDWNRAIAEGIPGGRSVGLEAAHLSNMEASEQFNAEVLAFLT